MTWGELAATVAHTRDPMPPPASPPPTAAAEWVSGYRQRDLAQVIDQHIAWQGTGSGPRHAMSLPALFAVVRLIASTIDQLPLVVDGGPTPEWLRRPRRYGSALDQGDLVQHVVAAMALHGKAYLLARRLTSGSWRLDALHPGSVGCQVTSSGVVGLTFTVDGRPVPRVPAWQSDWVESNEYLVHIPYLVTADRPEGTSPAAEAWESITGYLAVERQAADLLDGGTYSGGRLETDQDITADTARRYQDTWVTNRKTGKLPVLGAGLRYVNDVISPKDATWLESRLANAQAVAQMFGIPPDYLGMAMAGGSSSLSYNNAQDNDRRFRKNCLQAFTSQIEDALSLLLPPGRNEAEEQRVRFDFAEWEEGTADAAPEPAA